MPQKKAKNRKGGNPIGRGTHNVSVNVPQELVDRIDRLAKLSKMSRSKYCTEILTSAVDSGTVLAIKINGLPGS